MNPQDAIYAKASAMDNQDVPLEEWPEKLIEALAHSGYAVVPVELPPALLGEAAMAGVNDTGNPKHCWDFLVAKSRAYPRVRPNDALIRAAKRSEADSD